MEEDELEGLARAAGQAPEAFASHHLRRVNDPTTGRPRLSLREDMWMFVCTYTHMYMYV